jgi:hypothetical protein
MANPGGYAYISPEVNLICTGGAGFTLSRGVGKFYKTLNNIWRLTFNLEYTLTSSTIGDCAIVGVITPNIGTLGQSISGGINSTTVIYAVRFATNSGSIVFRAASAQTSWHCSGDIELASKPTAYLPEGV